MILIDLDADLNMEDDDGRNFTRILKSANQPRVGSVKSANQPRVGSVLVAGRPQFWSWVVIDEVDDDFVYFHQVSARHAATIAPLVAGVPTAG